jgi:hypothetical protein
MSRKPACGLSINVLDLLNDWPALQRSCPLGPSHDPTTHKNTVRNMKKHASVFPIMEIPVDRDGVIEMFAYSERMKTLTDQTASSSTFAACGLSISVFFGGVPMFGLPLTVVAAALFSAMAYGAWRSNLHYVEQSRRMTEQLAAWPPCEVTKPRGGFPSTHPVRTIDDHSTLIH